MTYFPNYLMNPQDNEMIENRQQQNKSTVAFHYPIDSKKEALPVNKEVIKTELSFEQHKSFTPTTVPSLLKGIKREEKIDYDTIIKSLTVAEELLILLDDPSNDSNEYGSYSNSSMRKAVKMPKKSSKQRLQQSMSTIMANQSSSIPYLSAHSLERE